MHDDETYALTPQGERELHSGATTLSAPELALLVRIDPQLTVGQLRAAQPELAPGEFERLFTGLRAARLIAARALDSFELKLQAELDNFVLPRQGASEAAAGLRSLQRSGYFVRIARAQAGAAAMPVARGARVLVVEDDTNVASFVSSYLAFEGFATSVAANRADALAALRQPPVPGLILLDVMLPDVDGFEILASLRRHAAFQKVPVIMLTGKATREAVLKGLALGADGYVTKPFEPDAMMTAVRTVLGWAPQGQAGKR